MASKNRAPYGNHIQSWGIILTKIGGYIILHNCGKKKHRRMLNKPVWGNDFKTKFKKWDRPKCARCQKDIPEGIITMAGMRDVASIAELNKVSAVKTFLYRTAYLGL